MSTRHKLPLSTSHLAAAVVFAVQAREFEQQRVTPLLLHPRSEHRAAAMGCILSAVGYLEANINEFFADAAEGLSDGAADTPAVINRLRNIWNMDAARSSILDKYDIALSLCDLSPFNRGVAPYQGVALLIRLRNALTHFVPQWQPTGGAPNEDAELSALARSLRRIFPENGLAEKHEPFFPDRCLGYGSSKWAVTQSVAFVEDFMSTLGVRYRPTYILKSIEKL
jgi:hypothetical protein